MYETPSPRIDVETKALPGIMSVQNSLAPSNPEPEQGVLSSSAVEVVQRSPPPSVKTTSNVVPTIQHHSFDIEHAPVEDDPRQWSHLRKVRRFFPTFVSKAARHVLNRAAAERQLDPDCFWRHDCWPCGQYSKP